MRVMNSSLVADEMNRHYHSFTFLMVCEVCGTYTCDDECGGESVWDEDIGDYLWLCPCCRIDLGL